MKLGIINKIKQIRDDRRKREEERPVLRAPSTPPLSIRDMDYPTSESEPTETKRVFIIDLA